MAIRPRPPPAWVLLRDRHGGHVLGPTEAQRAEALRELFHGEGGEHAECSLEYSRDGGPLYHVGFTSERGVRFEEWANPSLLAQLREAGDVSDPEALLLWRSLADGDLQAVLGWRWRP